MSHSSAHDWWKRSERFAGIKPKRTRLALTQGSSLPASWTLLKVLCELGGWRTTQPVRQCYQRTDEDRIRKALERQRKVCA